MKRPKFDLPSHPIRCGAAGIELVTGEDDTGARALYEKFGFRNETEGTQNARSLFYEIIF
ncbi:MAG: hypothetical protein ACSLFI_03995 [Solirubrobacterales bacterium]